MEDIAGMCVIVTRSVVALSVDLKNTTFKKIVLYRKPVDEVLVIYYFPCKLALLI